MLSSPRSANPSVETLTTGADWSTPFLITRTAPAFSV
jgi:hypothetical protein